jgi:hypothetical protein
MKPKNQKTSQLENTSALKNSILAKEIRLDLFDDAKWSQGEANSLFSRQSAELS